MPIRYLFLPAVLAFLFAAPASAAPITGTYTTGGDTVGAGTGPFTLTSNGPQAFSVLRFVLDNPIPFSQLAQLSLDYTAVSGGISQGSPRFAVVYDTNGDGLQDGQFLVLLGPSPFFVDPSLGPASTGNLLNNDTGRFDLSGSLGGSPFTNYQAALAAAGSFDVLRLSLLVDGPNQTFIVDGISAADAAPVAPVPEPGTLGAFAVMGAAGLGYVRRRLKAAAVAAA